MPKLISHRGKHLLPSAEYGLLRMVAPLCLSFALCLVSFVGCSWAWFTANQSVDVAVIQTATTQTIATVTVISDSVALAAEEEDTAVAAMALEEADGAFSFTAQANVAYQLNLTLEGNATTGYLLITTPEGVFYSAERQLQVAVLLSESGTVTISGGWGALPEGGILLQPGAVIGTGEYTAVTQVTVDVTALTNMNVYIGTSLEDSVSAAETVYIPGKTFIWFAPQNGTTMPTLLRVQIGDTVYDVYTDGRMQDGVLGQQPAFSHQSLSMDIPMDLLKNVTTITITPGDADPIATVTPTPTPDVEDTDNVSEGTVEDTDNVGEGTVGDADNVGEGTVGDDVPSSRPDEGDVGESDDTANEGNVGEGDTTANEGTVGDADPASRPDEGNVGEGDTTAVTPTPEATETPEPTAAETPAPVTTEAPAPTTTDTEPAATE